MISQKTKAQQLHQLHQEGSMLVLPNIWDSLGASLLENTNHKAVATGSASIAYTIGYQDGEKMPFDQVLTILKNIVDAVSLPVTADIESGYANSDEELEQNISLFLKTGIAGINIEDTNHKTGEFYSIEDQCRKIQIIKDISNKNDVPLFINARTDVIIHSNHTSAKENFDEMLKRGKAYKDAGADCFYPILLKDKEEIQKLVNELKMPVNILTIPGIPDLKTLKEIGVRRVSLGPSFLKIAIKAMKDLALKLQDLEGLNQITGNDITSDYLKLLIK